MSCSEFNIIRPNKTHRVQKHGPPVFDTNTRATLGSTHCIDSWDWPHVLLLLVTMEVPVMTQNRTF